MKLIVEKQGEIVKAIKAEYTPAEALIINHAMRRYICDEEVNATDREIMERILDISTYDDMTNCDVLQNSTTDEIALFLEDVENFDNPDHAWRSKIAPPLPFESWGLWLERRPIYGEV